MTTFQELKYTRPDYEQIKKEEEAYIEKLSQCQSYPELKELFLAHDLKRQEVSTMVTIASIRNTCDTNDAFYEAEMDAFYQVQGEMGLLAQKAEGVILASPWKKEFTADFGDLIWKEMEVGQTLANPAILDDQLEESRLCQEYSKLVAGKTATFRGEACNFYGLLKHMQNTDRPVRQEAFQAWAKMYSEVAPELDRIYDRLIELRKGMAEKLGFDSYISLAYADRGRFDYKPEDVAKFRHQVATKIVPLCQRLIQEQAGRLGVEQLQWYDEALVYPEGNAIPQGDRETLVKKAQQMYRELSSETGQFFDFMVEHQLFDLETRLGKHMGGYCTFLDAYKAPFIFSNFNGTSADVDVLTHEAGHCFEAYTASRHLPLSSMRFSTSEINEIHSMTMEHLAYPWMELFFGDQADKYRSAHLADTVKTIPYLVCVDEFQHRVFEENLDAQGRRRVWRELEHTYLPWREYDENEFLEEGGFWMQKQHIFLYPFYYVDYALAQVCAFQLYEQMCRDAKMAWDHYYKLCKSGGSRGYFDTLDYAGLQNPFQEETMEIIAKFLEEKLFG